ncbi:hypothetical protein [Photorhabdus luminescens]|nr:hypothetical protein [Photorhabdus luminescens]
MTNLPAITGTPDENNMSLITLYLPDEDIGKEVTEAHRFQSH